MRYTKAERQLMLVTGKRTCDSCGVEKPLSDYYAASPSGSERSSCKPCYNREMLDIKYRSVYGVSLEEVRELLKAQDSRCAICKKFIELKIGGRQRLGSAFMDHDHVTGKTRGLVCVSCNFVLGHSGDNIAVLIAAAEYLLKHQS